MQPEKQQNGNAFTAEHAENAEKTERKVHHRDSEPQRTRLTFSVTLSLCGE